LITFPIEFGSLTTAQLREKVKGLQNLAYQLGLEEGTCYQMNPTSDFLYTLIMLFFQLEK
jgi:hypothetical protein